MGQRRVEFVDCSLRDGQQSLLATRMTTEQCMRVLPMLRDCGYVCMELWGGATLDACLRFTGDGPFQRLSAFRETLDAADRHVELRSLCRGQSLFGYTPYADAVVYEFIKEAVRSGNDRVRIFDALNDPRNFQTALMTTKTFDGVAECAMSYTTSPVHDAGYFLRFAKRVMDEGADALAIKDMAGLLHPAECITLVRTIRDAFPDVNLTLHAHCTNGLATATYIAGLLEGVDRLDTCHGSLACGTAQPPVELMAWVCAELGVEHGLDLSRSREIHAQLKSIRGELADFDMTPERTGEPWPAEPPRAMRKHLTRAIELIQRGDRDSCDEAIALIEDKIIAAQGFPEVDRRQLEAQVPGGMVSNLHSQLKIQGQLEKLPEILEEIPRVRAEAGYVPLVTPTSQIVGSQAAMNVITGERYKVISNEFKSLILGKYGRLPGPVDETVMARCAAEGQVWRGRPADMAPAFEAAKVLRGAKGLAKSHRDLLLTTLFPEPAKQFFRQREDRELS